MTEPSQEAAEALKQRVDFPWDESREFKDGFQAALGQVESILTERDEAVDLLEAERKSPTSVERGEEFAAGFDAGQTEARNRWEQEVRERLVDALQKARQAHIRPGQYTGNLFQVEPDEVVGVQVVAIDDVNCALDSIFGEAEPVEGEQRG